MTKSKTASADEGKATDIAKRAARKAAVDRLIANHEEEFIALMLDEHAARGVIWQRRLSPEERAERDAKIAAEKAEAKAAREAARAEKALAEVLAKHPALREKVQIEEG